MLYSDIGDHMPPITHCVPKPEHHPLPIIIFALNICALFSRGHGLQRIVIDEFKTLCQNAKLDVHQKGCKPAVAHNKRDVESFLHCQFPAYYL